LQSAEEEMAESKNLPRKGMKFGKALLLMMAVGTTYALLIPVDVLASHPMLEHFASSMESVFPAIGSLARLSPIPQVVRLYYATWWVAFPFAFVWFLKCVDMERKPLPPTLTRSKAALFALVSIFVAALVLSVFGFVVSPAGSSIHPVATGGRGNALAAGLTSNSISIGVVSGVMTAAAFIFAWIAAVLTKHAIRAELSVRSNVNRK
jgi:hypothetical protein